MDSVKIVCNVKEKILKNGTGSLFLDLYINGKRSRETLSIYTSGKKRKTLEDKNSWALAEKVKAKKITEIAEGNYGFEKSATKKACFVSYFRKITEEEERQYNEGEKNAKTFHTYRSTLKRLESFTGGSLPFGQLDVKWLESFKAYLIRELPSPRTQSTYFAKIRAVINRAYRERVIQYNPVPAVKQISKEQSEKVYLLEQEVVKLVNTPCKQTIWKKAFLFSCFTGLRLSDVSNLTWDKVKGNTLHFRQQKTGGYEYLPMSKTALNILKSLEDKDSEKVFAGLEVGMGKRGYYLKRWALSAGIDKPITYHSSRHTYATMLLTKGVDLYTVSKLLGHQDIATTLIYAKIIDKVKDNAVDTLIDLDI